MPVKCPRCGSELSPEETADIAAQLVAAGNLGDEEDCGHRGLHHARHERGHAHQHEILLRHRSSHQVEAARQDEARDCPAEQRGAEGSSVSAACVRNSFGLMSGSSPS